MKLFVILLIASALFVPLVRADDGDDVAEVEEAGSGSDNEERSEFIQFQVEEVLDTFESNDIGEVINLFTDDAQGLWNGASLANKAAIQEAFAPFLDLLAHTRFGVTSPVYEHHRRATFTRTMFMESLVGCIATVRSLEEMVFDESGKIAFFRSEWDQPTQHIIDELNCKSDDKDRLRDELTPEKQKIADVVYEMMEASEQLDAAEITSFFADNAVWRSNGVPEVVGKDAIQQQYQSVFSQCRNFVSGPGMTVFVRDNVASYLLTKFVVTNTGCSSIFNVAVHLVVNDGKITQYDSSLVNMDLKDMGEWLQQDCGDKDEDEKNPKEEKEKATLPRAKNRSNSKISKRLTFALGCCALLDS